MAHEYDVCVIGLGPAGMAVSLMAAEMGLRVVGIERRSLGGECMSVGCIPSKALLRLAKTRHAAGLSTPAGSPAAASPFEHIADHLRFIDAKKTGPMFDKIRLVLREGSASFLDPHTVAVGDKKFTAKRIFVCTGSRPAIPPIPGLRDVAFLTNENLFALDRIPESLVILGGGAIGCEMAQAFHRLGARVSLVHMDEHLLLTGMGEAGRWLEEAFVAEGIQVQNGRRIAEVSSSGGGVAVRTNVGETLRGEKLLVAAGRSFDFSELRLENAGVEYSDRGIRVDGTLRTTARHIYAPGDVNGTYFLSHAAMHQGMIALLNSFLPRPFRRNFRSYVVPWAVFTEPEVAHVGWLEKDLKANDVAYEVIETKYEDYGAAIAEGIAVGSVRVYASPAGRIYGARIVGEGAAEMINEWGLAIQSRLRMHRLVFLQHAFPSMSFLSKRAAEVWMTRRMKAAAVQRLIRWLA